MQYSIDRCRHEVVETEVGAVGSEGKSRLIGKDGRSVVVKKFDHRITMKPTSKEEVKGWSSLVWEFMKAFGKSHPTSEGQDGIVYMTYEDYGRSKPTLNDEVEDCWGVALKQRKKAVAK